jgi:hypothetical protein
MNDYEPTIPGNSNHTKGSASTPVEDLEGAAFAPLRSASSSGWPISAIMAEQESRPRMRVSLSKMRRVLIVAAALMGHPFLSKV